MIKDIIEDTPDAEFGRAHLSELGEYSFVYTVVYYVLSGSFDKYAQIHQGILFNIKDTFDKHNIKIAYPAHTLHIGSLKQ